MLDPDAPRCTAVLWDTGKLCHAKAAPGVACCPAHLILLPPDQWLKQGYAAVLDPEAQALLPAARFVDISDEVALARLNLRTLLATKASAAELIAGLDTVARLVRLRHHLDRSRSEHLSHQW